MTRSELRQALVRGRTTRWRVMGEGPALVLLHGLAGSSSWWRRVAPSLAERYECHLLDLPRFGRPLEPEDAAEWLALWAEAAGLESFGVIGHSIGGAAAVRLAAVRPELVDALVLVAPVGMPSGRRLGGHILPLLAALRGTSPRFVARLALDGIRAGPWALARGALYAARADLREQVRHVRAPTLIVLGQGDPLVPAGLGDEWRHAIPTSRLVVVSGARHVPMIEQAEPFAAALHEFFDQLGDPIGRGPMSRVRGSGDDRQSSVD